MLSCLQDTPKDQADSSQQPFKTEPLQQQQTGNEPGEAREGSRSQAWDAQKPEGDIRAFGSEADLDGSQSDSESSCSGSDAGAET